MNSVLIKELVSREIKSLIENGQLDEAQAFINEYISNFHDNEVTIISYQSVVYLMQGDSQKCIQYLEPLADSLLNVDIFYNLGTAYETTLDYINAVLYYRKAQLISLDRGFRKEITEKISFLIYKDSTDEKIYQYLQYLGEIKEYMIHRILYPTSEKTKHEFIKTPNPFKDDMRSIFLGTMEIANHMAQYTTGFRALEKHVFSLNYYPSYLQYKNDLSLDMKALDIETQKTILILNAVDLIAEYDIFHFVFNTTLLPGKQDLVFFKELDKRVFMHCLGSEIRIPSIARTHHEYWRVAEEAYLMHLDEDYIKSDMENISSYIDNVIVNDFEMFSYVKDYYNKVYMIGLPITLEMYPYCPSNNSKPIIVHAPTKPGAKGSSYFIQAVENLKRDFDFEFIKIQGYSHEDAKALYKKADIVLDELVVGTYGSLTIESLAMGKCVVTYLCEKFGTPHGVPVPVQIATIDNVEEKIRELLESRTLRESLSQRGRAYAEEYCDSKKICKNLLDIYFDITKPYKKGE